MAEKTLKSGKVVEIRVLSALDEVLGYQLMGKGYDEKNQLGSAVLHRCVMALLSIDKIDGEDFAPPSTLEDVFKKLAEFPKPDWKEVMDLYSAVNEQDLGE